MESSDSSGDENSQLVGAVAPDMAKRAPVKKFTSSRENSMLRSVMAKFRKLIVAKMNKVEAKPDEFYFWLTVQSHHAIKQDNMNDRLRLFFRKSFDKEEPTILKGGQIFSMEIDYLARDIA